MRPAPRGFCPRLFIGARLRVYLPVDHGGAPIGVARYLRVFISIHACPTFRWIFRILQSRASRWTSRQIT